MLHNICISAVAISLRVYRDIFYTIHLSPRRPSRKHVYIMLTQLNPLLYSKTGFTGVYIMFVFIGKAVLTSTHNLCFEQKLENYMNFSFESFQFLVVKFSVYLKQAWKGRGR